MQAREIFAGSPASRYTVPSNRDLYLDLSFIRSRGRALVALPDISRCYTGALTFIELLGDICASDREFMIRRSAISTLIRADISIDWQIPNRKIPAAFAPLRLKYDVFDDTIEYLQKLAHVVVQSGSLADFKDRTRNSPLAEALEHFRKLDRQIDKVHREEIEDWIAQSPRAFADPSRSMLFEALHLPDSTTHEELCRAMAGSVLGCQIIVYAYVELYSEAEGITDPAAQEQLYDSYDHSIDAFIAASASKMWGDAATQRHPTRNDGADETHLLYLSPGATLITGDRGFAKWVETAGVPVRYESGGG